MGVASLVIGIIALVCWFIPYVGSLLGVILAILGVILGAVGKKNNKSCAIGGLVVSIIALVLCGIGFFACGGMAACAALMA